MRKNNLKIVKDVAVLSKADIKKILGMWKYLDDQCFFGMNDPLLMETNLEDSERLHESYERVCCAWENLKADIEDEPTID